MCGNGPKKFSYCIFKIFKISNFNFGNSNRKMKNCQCGEVIIIVKDGNWNWGNGGKKFFLFSQTVKKLVN